MAQFMTAEELLGQGAPTAGAAKAEAPASPGWMAAEELLGAPKERTFMSDVKGFLGEKVTETGAALKSVGEFVTAGPGMLVGAVAGAGRAAEQLVKGKPRREALEAGLETSGRVGQALNPVAVATKLLGYEPEPTVVEHVMEKISKAIHHYGEKVEVGTNRTLLAEDVDLFAQLLMGAGMGKATKRAIDAGVKKATEPAKPGTSMDDMVAKPAEPAADAPVQSVGELLVIDKAKQVKEMFKKAKARGMPTPLEVTPEALDGIFERARSGTPAEAPKTPLTPEQAVAQSKTRIAEGLPLSEARAKLDAEAAPPTDLALAIEKVRGGRAFELTAEEKISLDHSLKVKSGVLLDHNGRPFEKGAVDPDLLKGILAVGGVAAFVAANPEKAEEVAWISGGALAIKGKGGNWHPETVRTLAEPLKVAMTPNMREANGSQLHDLALKQSNAQADRMVTSYLNKHAGTATDPLKDVRLPDGQRWEDITDKAFRGPAARNFQQYEVMQNESFSGYAAYDGTGKQVSKAFGEASDAHAWAKENKPKGFEQFKPDEPVWLQGQTRPFEALKSHLSHVGDFLRMNVKPEDLAKYDLVRAVKESAANDARVAKEMEKAALASTKDLPVYKDFGDGMKWVELKLPEELTPEQLKSVRHMTETEYVAAETPGYGFVALDAKGEPIVNNYTRSPSYGVTPESAWLAGKLAEEGNCMGHCVGGYVDEVASGATRILSLRDKKGQSHVTVEMERNPDYPKTIPKQVGAPGMEVETALGLSKIADKITGSIDKYRQAKVPEHNILQIKGKQNRAPVEAYQPYVQDFVKSGTWGEVRDLQNTGGLIQHPVTKAFHTLEEVLPEAIAKVEKSMQNGPYPSTPNGFRADQVLNDLKTAQRYLKEGRTESAYGELYDLPWALKLKGSADPALLAKVAAGVAAGAYLAQNPDSTLGVAALGLGLTMKGKPEIALLESLRKGGKDAELAATELYTRTHKQVERTLRAQPWAKHISVEEALNDGMYSAIKSAADGSFRGDAKFSTYATTAVLNRGKNQIRDSLDQMKDVSIHEKAADGSDFAETLGHQNTPEKAALTRVLGDRINEALEKIDPKFKEAFLAVEAEGLSYAEASAKLGVPENTIASQVSRAKKELQGHLRDYRDVEAGATEQVLGGATGRLGKGEGGAVDPKVLGALAAVSGGAVIGGLLDPEHPVRSAVYGALAGGVLGTGAGRGALKAAITSPDLALGLISTRLGNIAPELKFKLRSHELNVLKAVDAANDAALPFIHALQKLPKEMHQQAARALLNGNTAVIESLPGLRATYPAVQKILGQLESQLQGLGRFGEGVSNYFPRIVKDFEGLKAAMGQEAKVGLEKRLVEAEAKMIRKKGRGLTDVEQSLVVNNYLFAPDQGSFQKGFTKGRKLQEVPENLQQFYEPPTESLLRYLSGAVNDIEVARFFGRDLASKGKKKLFTDLDSSIGNLTDRLHTEGKITQPQMMELRKILKARFEGGEQGMGTKLAVIRNLTNTGLLGNVASAATQIGDSFSTIYHHGLVPTLQAVTEKIIGRERVNPKQLGLINHVAEELSEMGATGRALHLAMKYSGFKAIDMFAKGIGLNAALIKNQKLVGSAEGAAQFRAKYQAAFGERTEAVIADLKAGRRTAETDQLAFSELSDAQPISKAEMPEMYLKHPDGRLLYQLKTYMLKQTDIIRRDAYQEIAKGTPEGIMRGTKNLAALATVYALANVPGDVVKDLLAGREVDPFTTPKLVENVFQTFGINRYAGQQLAQGRVVETAIGMATPPVRVLQDIAKLDAKAGSYVPIVGRPLYERFGGGNEKREIHERQFSAKGDKKPLSPAAKAYLREKRLKAKEAARK